MLRDVKLQPIGVGRRIHIVGGGELPSLACDEDETMVAQVVIGIADQHVENDALPQLLKISFWRGSVPYQHFGDLQVDGAS
ncbi:hypothetical protein D9M71_722560 [compost metagenome]